MSIVPVTSDDFDTFTIVTRPHRTFSSSSSGITGSVYLYARRSSIERDARITSAYVDSTFQDASADSTLKALQDKMIAVTGDQGTRLMEQYLEFVNAQGTRDRSKMLGVIRFVPPVEFNSNTMRKLVTKDVLYHHYCCLSPTMQWAYTNYHALNFFSASCVPSSSVLLYPNVETTRDSMGYISGAYVPSGAFSFDFYINPRYAPEVRDGEFNAGTLLHLSSCFALSLVSGSCRDNNGLTLGYRMMLQLSHSADIPPSMLRPYGVNGAAFLSGGNVTMNAAGYPSSDLTFMSSDNSLWRGHWHHVVVRWGTDAANAGSGSFNIDGVEAGTFCVPSASIAPMPFTLSGNPDVLCVGNYYEGTNSGSSVQCLFFAEDPAEREGLETLVAGTGVEGPTSYVFRHPLNAEVHDLAIRTKYMTDQDIIVSQSVGPALLDDTYLFYVPPFFTRQSPIRRSVAGFGGVMQTPFFEVDGATDDPFNIALSFGVNGFQVNVDNFVRDFVNDLYPRKLYMTASIIDTTGAPATANEILYNEPSHRRGNLLIVPCDDGTFVPNYSLLMLEDNTSKYVDSLGIENYSLITLDNLVDDSSHLFGSSFISNDKTEAEANEFIDVQVGFTPEVVSAPPGPAMTRFINASNRAVADGTYLQGVQAGAPLTIYQRTLDSSSNLVVFFDVSNVLYGMQIEPGTIVIRDVSLSGSDGRVRVTLRDDGNGNLYRADSETPCATWNSVGNVFYAEGVIVVKSPHLAMFGKDAYELEFNGEQHVHVLCVDALANVNAAFSSSNPTYRQMSPSGYANDPDSDFTYISNIYLHDDNYNVIAKASLAQPIMKRRGDKYAFKLRIDW